MSLMMPMRQNVDQGRVVIDFDSIKIRLASPEKIRSWSHGESRSPRPINYRTFKPERDGLSAPRSSAHHRLECLCGKYKRMKHRADLRQVRRRGDAVQGPPRAHGHIEWPAGQARVFFKGCPAASGTCSTSRCATWSGSLLRVVRGGGPGDCPESSARAGHRRAVPPAPREVPPPARLDGRGGIKELLRRVDVEHDAVELREKMRTENSVQKDQVRQAPEGRGGVPQERQQAGVDDRTSSGHPARAAPPGAAGRRPLRHLRPERPLPARHQPQQPPEEVIELRAPDVIVRTEKQHAAGGVDALSTTAAGRVLRGPTTHPSRARHLRASRAASARTCSASASTTRALRHRRRPRAEAAPVRPPQKMASAVQAVIYSKLEKEGLVPPSRGQGDGRAAAPEVWDFLEDVNPRHPCC